MRQGTLFPQAMAGITSSFACKPLLTRTTKTKPSLLESNLFGVRLYNPDTIRSCSISLSSSLSGSITARYGGGSRSSGSGNSRQYRKSDSDDEQALDISTIRWLFMAVCMRAYLKLDIWRRLKLNFLVLKQVRYCPADWWQAEYGEWHWFCIVKIHLEAETT